MLLRSLGLLALMALFVAECVLADRADAPTYDETTHLPAGYLHLVHGDYRFQVDHPPLAKMLAAAAAWLAGARAPSVPPPVWREDLANRFDHRGWGWQFLYRTPGNDAERLIGAGRLAIVAVALGLLAVLWSWSRRLHGTTAALVVGWLAAVDPNLIAHGHLVTADMAVTVWIAAATYALWRSLVHFRVGTALTAGGLLGLGLASKYTALLLVPVAVLVPLARALDPAPWPGGAAGAPAGRTRPARLARALLLIALLLGAAWLTLWAAYRFRPAAAPHAAVELTERGRAAWFPEPRSWAVEAVAGAVRWRLLPDAWGFGLLYLGADARLTPRTSYLAGELSEHGWWYYFPAALGLKTPLGTLALAGIGIAGALASRRRGEDRARRWGNVCMVAVPAVVLGVAATSSLDLGLRQVLPVYPFLLLAAGRGVALCLETARPWGAAVVAGLALWVGAGSAAVAPAYLAYFNEIAGGPGNGARWLVDSNLDWGQALRLLPGWLTARGIEEVNLCYFGTADPDAYALRYVRLPGGTSYSQPPAAPRLPGYVAISATHRAGVHFGPELRAWYRALLARGQLVGVVGHAIYVYRVPQAILLDHRPDSD